MNNTEYHVRGMTCRFGQRDLSGNPTGVCNRRYRPVFHETTASTISKAYDRNLRNLNACFRNLEQVAAGGEHRVYPPGFREMEPAIVNRRA